MLYEEKTVKSENFYKGKILSLRVDTVELPDAKYSKREIVEHSGGVGIAAVTEENKLIVVRQYRKAVEQFLYEIPAGKLEPNEVPLDTASRELEEETGYKAGKLKYLMEFFPTPGYCNEKIFIFLAQQLEKGEPHFDETENIELHEFSLDELMKMIDIGEIQDAKTIVAIYMVKDILKENGDKLV